MGYSSELVQKIKGCLAEQKDLRAGEGEPIAVHAAVTRASSLYENLRNAIDYRDEHLLRKGAIARILRRRLALSTDIEEISIALLRELVAAGYLPNTSLPESLAHKVAKIVGRYDVLRRCRTASDTHYAWLYGVTVAELDELFDANAERRGLSFFLYERLAESVVLSKEEMDPQERRLQIYIACIRTFQRAEDDTLSLTLLRGHFPEWTTPESWIQAPQEVAYRLVGIESLIRRTLRHHWSVKFLQAVRPYAVALRAVVDALSKDDGYDLTRLDHADKFQKEIVMVADTQMSRARSRLRRGVARAIVYLLITRIVLGVIRLLLGAAIGIPPESIIYGEIDKYSFFVNIALPPVLMLFLGMLIRLPGERNTERIAAMAQELLGAEPIPMIRVSLTKARSFLGRFVVNLVYSLMFILTFGMLSYALWRIHFTLSSGLTFLFFLCIVSFFAFRLRMNARETVVLRRPERFTTAIVDFFSYPILRAGHSLTAAVSKINILILFFDVLVEAPFKLFLSALEHWFAFMRDRREEIE